MTRLPLSKSRLSWLQAESARWRDDGIVDAAGRERIIGGYEVAPSSNRGMIALVVLAVLAGGVGLLLLIGYNWDQIPRTVKVAGLVGAVALAFAGAAAAYARQRRTIGEALAFTGTVLLANAIWLVAQVLHIQGHFPDAFLWIALGCLATSWLVRSRWIGIEAAILLVAWLLAENTMYPRPLYSFLLLAPAATLLAYDLRSAAMLRVVAFGGALWVLFAIIGGNAARLAPAAVGLTGCALYAAGRWHREGEGTEMKSHAEQGRSGDVSGTMRAAWQETGIVVLLLVLIALMIGDTHQELARQSATTRSLVIALTMAVAAFSAAAIPARSAADNAVLAVAAAVTVWAGMLWIVPGTASASSQLYAVVAFSLMTVVMAASLVRSAFVLDRRFDLYLGVLFALALIVVRWTNLVENMMWSGLLLLLTAGGLLAVAWFWRNRDRHALESVSA